MSFRDSKGFSLTPDAHAGVGALFDWSMRDDMDEIADALDVAAPSSPAAVRTRALLARLDSIQAELQAEWLGLGPMWRTLGHQIENGWADERLIQAPGVREAIDKVPPSGTGG